MRGTRSLRLAGLTVLLLLGIVTPRCGDEARAEDGGGGAPDRWSEGPVEVVRVFQPGIIQIGRNGRTVPLHLVGLEGLRRADTGLLRLALERVEEWVSSGGVTLVEPGRGPKGELVGSLRLADGSNLGERLLRNGLALYQPHGLSETYRAIFLGAQRQAAVRELGVWGLPKMETSDVVRLQGQVANVCGDAIASQRQTDGSWLVYLGTYPHRALAIRIPEDLSVAFGAPEFSFVRQEVCVRGRVGQGDLLPEVTVFDPKQIEELGMGQSF